MASNEKVKQSLYFPEDMLGEIMKEASRLDRSLSWTVQQAWRIAREEVRNFRTGPLPRDAVPPRHARPRPAREASPAVAEPRSEASPTRPSTQVLEFLRGKFDREVTG